MYLSLYLHLLHTCEYYIVIIPSPRVFGSENPYSVLVDYVRPQRGINNHVNPRGIGSKNTILMFKFRHLLFYYVVSIVISSPFSLVIWA
jgi:hypothetical protein